jgi:hypothetical protein
MSASLLTRIATSYACSQASENISVRDGGIHALLGRSLEFRMAVRTLLGLQATLAATDRLDARLSLSDKNTKSGLAIQKGLEPVAKLSVIGPIGINRSVNANVIQTKRAELGRDCRGGRHQGIREL